MCMYIKYKNLNGYYNVQISRGFSFKERCLRPLLRQYSVVVHKIPNQVIMSCWSKSYYNHAEQVSSPSLGKVQDFPLLKIYTRIFLFMIFTWSSEHEYFLSILCGCRH